MRELEERMRHDGAVRPSNVLKVDSFLNHGCDMQLYQHMADEWARRLAGEKVDKVLTIETSGIGLACVTALALGCPTVVFARKKESQNLQGSQWRTSVHSYTHNRDYTVVVEKKLLNPNERIVIVDDYLANGSAAEGLLDLCKQAHAEVVAMCFAIEKSFQPGRNILCEQGIRVESLARISSMDATTGEITFISDESEA